MLSVYTLEDSEKWDTIVRSFHEHDIYWLSGYVRTFNARIFWAEKDGGVVAASMMIFANGYLNFHLSGSLEEYNTLAPNNLILYEAAIWGCENGYKTFLLGGGLGSKDDTLLRYKKTFHRGDRNHFFIGKKIIRPDLYKELVDMSGLNESPFFPQYRAFSET